MVELVVWVVIYLALIAASLWVGTGGRRWVALAIIAAFLGFLLTAAAPAFSPTCYVSKACTGNVATGVVFGGLLALALVLVPAAILFIRHLYRSEAARN